MNRACPTGKIRYRDRIAALLAIASTRRTDGPKRGEGREARVPLPAVPRLAPHIIAERRVTRSRWRPHRRRRTINQLLDIRPYNEIVEIEDAPTAHARLGLRQAAFPA